MTIITTQYEHTLEVSGSAVHPANGNVYLTACLKEGGIKQHLGIYRLRPGAAQVELVKMFLGGGGAGAYAQSQITSGAISLRQDGSLVVAFSCVPMAYTGGKFVPVFEVIGNVDTPWGIPVSVAAVSGTPITLNPPSGFKMYGGTDPSYQPSADGTHWFAQCAHGPRGFGTYVFQQANAGSTAVEKPYGELMEGRGVLQLAGNGALYVTGSNDNNVRPQVYPVVGYRPFGNTITVINSVGGAGGGGVDQVARDMATASATVANKAKGVADSAYDRAVEAKTKGERAEAGLAAHISTEHLTSGKAAEIAWNKANEALFAAVDNPDASQFGNLHFRSMIKSLAQETLLDALAWARKSTAEQSKLRDLIEYVVFQVTGKTI